MLHEMAEEHPYSPLSPATYKRRNNETNQPTKPNQTKPNQTKPNRPTNHITRCNPSAFYTFSRPNSNHTCVWQFTIIITQLLYRIGTDRIQLQHSSSKSFQSILIHDIFSHVLVCHPRDHFPSVLSPLTFYDFSCPTCTTHPYSSGNHYTISHKQYQIIFSFSGNFLHFVADPPIYAM
jgi:hypothetical protein